MHNYDDSIILPYLDARDELVDLMGEYGVANGKLSTLNSFDTTFHINGIDTGYDALLLERELHAMMNKLSQVEIERGKAALEAQQYK